MQGQGRTAWPSTRLERLRESPGARKVSAGAVRVQATAARRSVLPQGVGNRRLLPPTTTPLAFSSQVSYVASHPSLKSRNPLVQRSTIGKAKPLNPESSVVSPDHCYGFRAAENSKNNARAVLHEWQLHRPSSPRQDMPNFRAINKRGLLHGAVTAKGLTAYRKSNPVFSSRQRGSFLRTSPLPSEHNPCHCYGYKAPPEPGMRQLIQNAYGLAQMQLLARRCQAHEGNREVDEIKMRLIRLTKAARGHASGRYKRYEQPEQNPHNGGLQPYLGRQKPESSPQLFKMKRFLKVPARTSSWWNSSPL
ncbi:flagellar associated protein [Cystoisospora suis]|uniref:Flagellar associated protein n=1 Tax=Cystoisospora suis TaxID=483139 RepID=A0A2C6KVE7_9APIC|nr:flagellar associated protein [Cystoisospora suis]